MAEKTDFNLDLNQPHKNQLPILQSKARYRIVACGRRFGKSETAKIAANLRLFRGQHIWYCSPTNRNSKRMFREFIKLYKAFPEEYVKINRTDMRIDFLFNDGSIEFITLAEPDNLRGDGLNFVIIDEAAFVQDHVWDEIISPMLLETKGDALFISSTNGKNWFWRLWNLGNNDEEKNYESFQFTSYDNPLIDKEDIDELRKRTPSHVFDREYMAVFEEDGGSVFRNISGCLRLWTDVLDENLKRELERNYVVETLEKNLQTIVFGIDWGQLNDYTVITVFDLESRSLIEYVRINQMAWADIRSEIKRLSEKWNPILILAEENNATANIEELAAEGFPIEGFVTSAKSKPIIINRLSLVVENNDISLPDDKIMILELAAYSMTQSKAGNIKYGAPSGLHDDIVMSLAIAFNCTDLVLLPEAFKVLTV